MDDLASALHDAGGADAPRERVGQLRTLLAEELAHGRGELALARSGRERPVVVAFAADGADLLAVAPVARRAARRPGRRPTSAPGCCRPRRRRAGRSRRGRRRSLAGELGGSRARPARDGADDDAELAALAFEEQVARRRPPARARARAARPRRSRPTSPSCARRSARATRCASPRRSPGWAASPADPASIDEHEDAVLALLDRRRPAPSRARTTTPIRRRRVARRILQRLDGMGKWGGYHTEFAHLARGFAGNDRALAEEVGEALLAAGLLAREAERRPAPRVPQPAPGRRHPRAHRARRRAAGPASPVSLAP